MNTNTLVRHYDRLTPWERVALVMAAVARGDETERQRLADTAPISGSRAGLVLRVAGLLITRRLHIAGGPYHSDPAGQKAKSDRDGLENLQVILTAAS